MHTLCLLAFAQIYIISFTIITCYALHVIAVYNIEVVVYDLCNHVSIVVIHIVAITSLVFAILCFPIILVDGWIREIENTY